MHQKLCVACGNPFTLTARVNTKEYERRKACSYLCAAKVQTKSLVGVHVGMLTVLEQYRQDNKTFIKCRCDCGEICIKSVVNVFRGGKQKSTKSCGCLAESRKRPSAHRKFWASWGGMKARAKYPKLFPHYKGITIEKEWLSPKVFFRDMHKSFLEAVKTRDVETISIDRIDPSLGYIRGNCRWASLPEQARNKKSSWLIESRMLGVIPAKDYDEKTGKKILYRIYGKRKIKDDDIIRVFRRGGNSV